MLHKSVNCVLTDDLKVLVSVGDPDPDVFGPPGSGSISQRGMDPDPDPSLISKRC